MSIKTKDKYKTELCKQFETTGSCKFGKTCKYAHVKLYYIILLFY